MSYNYGTVQRGKLLGDSLDFEEQVRSGEVVLDEDEGTSGEMRKSPGLIGNNRKPSKGRGRGAVLPTAFQDDEDEICNSFGSAISPNVSPTREILSSKERLAMNTPAVAKDRDIVKQDPNKSPSGKLSSSEKSLKTGLVKERAFSQQYVPYGRGTVPSRVRNDNESSPGVKHAHQISSKSESSPKDRIQDVCLKSREIVLQKISQSEQKELTKSADSDDEESLNDMQSNPKMQSCSQKEDPGELKVEYGCIQLADIPGRVLVRGGETQRPLSKIEMLDNYAILKRGINNCGIEDLNMLQKAVAPYVFSGADCFILGGKTCGKTLSYLMPMIANCITDFEIKGSYSRDNEIGPVAIIICKDFRSGLKIEGHINNLVTSANKYQILGALICDDRKETRQKLEIGVDIMITTLDFACIMAKRNYNTLQMDSVRTLVFEEIDVLLRLSPDNFHLIRQTTDNFVSKLSTKKPFQRIFCGREWTPDIEDLYMKIQPIPDPTIGTLPAILIQSPNHAVKYSKLELQFHHIPDGPVAKLHKLKELLCSKSLEVHLDVFIACSSPNVVRFVHEGLEKFNIDTRCAETMTMNHHELGAIKRRWQDSPGRRRILVIHDKILRSLQVHNVTLLIHFDLPEKTPHVTAATGADRFSCMWGNFRDLSKEKSDPSLVLHRKRLESHFLLSGEEPELYKLKVFGSKLGCKMPESLDKLADQLGKLHMDRKKVCPYIKLYGECFISMSEPCPFRHYFLAEELEKDPAVPRSCELELRITHCINPSQYIGQIIRLHEIEKGKRKPAISYANLLKKRTDQLTAFYEVDENRAPLECYASGTICAVELPDGEGYARAVIDKVMTRTSLNLPNAIRVYCLDTGEHLQPLAEDLLILTDEMKNARNLAVEINLSNLQPPKGETDYRPHHIQGAKNLTRDKILVGRVRFAIGSEVWINPLIEMEIDPTTKSASKKLSIRLDLIRSYFAENNENHMSKIFELCKATGFVCPELDDDFELEAKLPPFFQLGDEINWAYLVVNPAELITQSFWPSYTRDPYNIFGIQDKFTEQLDNLEEEVNTYGQQMAEELGQKCAMKFATMYAPDMMVVAFDSVDSLWRRALITLSYEKGDQSIYYDIYFVDVGETVPGYTAKDLLPIPIHLVNRLPCQAIAVRLSHIRPVRSEESDGRWPSDVMEKLLSMTLNDDEDAVQVDVLAHKSILHPTLPCRYYEAILLQYTGEDVGETLVKANYAEYAEEGEDLVTSIRRKLLQRMNQAIDAQIGIREDESSDEDADNMAMDDDDEDRWDIGGMTMDQRRQIVESFGRNGMKKHVVMADTNDDNAGEVNQEMESSAAANSSPAELNKRDTNSSPHLKLPLFSELLHPTVTWKQTKLELTLNIQLPDIKEYEFKVEKKTVSFRCSKPAGYGFDLQLCGRVHNQEIELFGLYMKVKLKKRVEWLWPSILAEGARLPWLKQDIMDADSDDDRDQDWSTNVDKGKNHKSNLLPYELSSDSDSEGEVDDVELNLNANELTSAEINEVMTQLKIEEDS